MYEYTIQFFAKHLLFKFFTKFVKKIKKFENYLVVNYNSYNHYVKTIYNNM